MRSGAYIFLREDEYITMNLDANVQKIIATLLSKWKVLIAFTLIGVLVAYFYTANFTTLTYTSTVEFLAYAVDTTDEFNDSSNNSTNNNSNTNSADAVRTSNTSKMNYAMRMLNTYIEIMSTNEFNSRVASEMNDRINGNYTAATIKHALTIEGVEDTAMFKITVETTSADLSYEIAHQLETTVPAMFEETNQGLVHASVEDKPIKASSAGSLGYPKKCIIGAGVGFILAAAYIVLRFLLDVRIKSSEELLEKYEIPVLGSIPNFEIRGSSTTNVSTKETEKGDEVLG